MGSNPTGATKIMNKMRNIEVPTGNILVVPGEYGDLECLSIGDYGKEVNLKSNVLGLTKIPNKVRHTKLLPLEEKWVITISTQYGCSMGCTFCDVPKVGPGKNATLNDLLMQVEEAMNLHPEVEYSQRLNIHLARMGEPSWNPNVLDAAAVFKTRYDYYRNFNVHPVVSTMMPEQNRKLEQFLFKWMKIKNEIYGGNAGLQLSINSTNDDERHHMFNGKALTLEDISGIMCLMPKPIGRKITLNFAIADYEIDPSKLLRLFDPKDYIIKLTPMHKTIAALDNGIKTVGDYTTYHPYEHHEKALVDAGYDVLVFIASEEEDLGRITCGNAILSGTMPLCEYNER